MDYDQTTVPEQYDAGREISADKKREFIARFAKTIGTKDINKIIDLGCGTGRFSEALADTFDANVLGVEPSTKMIEQARAKHQDVRLRFQNGSGEELPAPDSSIDMVFMSMVLHHLADPQKVAVECWRTLRTGGHVCIRNTVADEIDSYPYLDVFPSIRGIIAAQLLSRARLNSLFEPLGFTLVAGETSWHEIATSASAFAEKIALRADSFVAQVPDREFAAGVAALRERAQTGPADEPVGLNVDLIVYELS